MTAKRKKKADEPPPRIGIGGGGREPATSTAPAQVRGSAIIDVQITVLCERIGKVDWRALFYDRITEQFYGGSGKTALEAIAWCLDEYVRRGVNGDGPMQARTLGARPGESFA